MLQPGTSPSPLHVHSITPQAGVIVGYECCEIPRSLCLRPPSCLQVLSACSNAPLPVRILPAAPGAARLLLTDPWDMLDRNARGVCDADAAAHAGGGAAAAAPRGVMLLEAVAGGAVGGGAGGGAGGLGLRRSVAVYACSLRAVAREAHGVVMVTHLDTGACVVVLLQSLVCFCVLQSAERPTNAEGARCFLRAHSRYMLA